MYMTQSKSIVPGGYYWSLLPVYCWIPATGKMRPCVCDLFPSLPEQIINGNTSLYGTVHDTWKWTVPHQCHSRQNSREMPRVEHLAYHLIINRGSSIPMPLEPSSINRAQNVSQISQGRLVDRVMSVRGFWGTHVFCPCSFPCHVL